MEPRNLVRRLVPAGATLWLTVIAGLPLASACDHAGEPVEPELSWLEIHAVPIATADPDIPDAALAALRNTIGDARIVGMGEATHGTAEFWKIRQKLSRYLVEEMGFTAILHEAPFPNALYIDRYVTEGEGSALEAHRKLGYWRYQEMQDLIAWIREHNLQRADGEPALHYFGYDCAFFNWAESINLLAEYLGRVDPDAMDDITTRLNNYTLEDARYVVEFLTANAADYEGRSSPEEYALMLRVAENLEPSWQVWYNLQNGIPEMDVRESFNVANVNWIIQHLVDGGKVIIWAHDGHVGNTYLENAGTQAQMLGSRLREQYGNDYYVIGTEFYLGRFLAWDACPGGTGDFIAQQAAIPPGDSYAYRFHEAGIPLFYLNLRGVDLGAEGATWLPGPLKIRYIGASYCADYDEEFYYATSLPVHYDGIVFFENTNPTTPITF